MNSSQRKLFLAVKILGAGILVALLWHAWGLHRGYPYNTFFYSPERRFMDLGDFLHCASLPDPYRNQEAFYFPASYFVLGSLTRMNEGMSLGLFFLMSFFGLWLRVLFALRSIKFEGLRFFPPMAFRYFISLGLLFLFVTVCFKFYPILLTALFLRPRHVGKIWLTVTGAFMVTVCSLASFKGSLMTNWHLWQQNIADFKEAYITHNLGMGGSASPWNTIRALLGTADYLTAGAPRGYSVILPGGFMQNLYAFYVGVFFFVTLAVVAYTVLIETEFFRRAILLLLLIAMMVPVGSDYRLIYANIALVILIVLPSQRRHDFLAIGLLTLALIPKKEIFLAYLGVTDSHTYDIPVAVLINPPCLLAAMAFLISDGWKQSLQGYSRQRFSGMIRTLIFQRIATAS